MFFALSLFALAAITAAPPSPASAGTPAPVDLRDIAPPVDVFPYPQWMVVAAAALALAVLACAVWLIVRWLRNRPQPLPPSATAVALRELEKLRGRVNESEPYAFSIAASDVLRTFISSAKFHLPATHQTSPEILAAASSSPQFSQNDRELLARFLEKCDMIKFARIEATSADNGEAVESALAFVRGGRA